MARPKPKTTIVPMRALSDQEALQWLVQRGRMETSTAALSRDWRWSTSKVKSRLERWSAAGEIEVKPGLGGRTVITASSATGPSTAPRTNAAAHVVPDTDGDKIAAAMLAVGLMSERKASLAADVGSPAGAAKVYFDCLEAIHTERMRRTQS